MTDGQFTADTDGYRQAAALNVAPPPITSDPVIGWATPIEQLLGVLGLAANAGDIADDAENRGEHAVRDAEALAAADTFAAQDQQAATALTGQLPQLAAGIAGSLAGAFGQLPQQAAGGVMQALQAAAGLAQGIASPIGVDAGASTGDGLDDLEGLGDFDDLGDLDDFGDLDEPGENLGGDGGPAVGGALGPGLGTGWPGSTPTGAPAGGLPGQRLGPPPVPSAATAPASLAAAPVLSPASPPQPVSPGGGMVPLVPPGAMNAAAGAGTESRADTKRVSAPQVRNGAPVQGRLSVPEQPAVCKPEARPLTVRNASPTE